MPKRFTATEKWDDPWFFGLSNDNRVLWQFLLDKCDHAGIWDTNWPLAEVYIRFKPDLSILAGRIESLPSGKTFIPKFLDFQYPHGLDGKNNTHKSVIFRLQKEIPGGSWQGLVRTWPGPQDMDMDIDKVKVIRFTPPTSSEVALYCQERNNGIDAQAFVNYYKARGWMAGKNKMKDWKAAVGTWERNERERNGAKKVGYAKPVPNKYGDGGIQ